MTSLFFYITTPFILDVVLFFSTMSCFFVLFYLTSFCKKWLLYFFTSLPHFILQHPLTSFIVTFNTITPFYKFHNTPLFYPYIMIVFHSSSPPFTLFSLFSMNNIIFIFLIFSLSLFSYPTSTLSFWSILQTTFLLTFLHPTLSLLCFHP